MFGSHYETHHNSRKINKLIKTAAYCIDNGLGKENALFEIY